MDVLSIVDQNHQRSVGVADHSRRFIGIYSIANPRFTGYNIENRGIRNANFQKKIEEIIV